MISIAKNKVGSWSNIDIYCSYVSTEALQIWLVQHTTSIQPPLTLIDWKRKNKQSFCHFSWTCKISCGLAGQNRRGPLHTVCWFPKAIQGTRRCCSPPSTPLRPPRHARRKTTRTPRSWRRRCPPCPWWGRWSGWPACPRPRCCWARPRRGSSALESPTCMICQTGSQIHRFRSQTEEASDADVRHMNLVRVVEKRQLFKNWT